MGWNQTINCLCWHVGSKWLINYLNPVLGPWKFLGVYGRARTDRRMDDWTAIESPESRLQYPRCRLKNQCSRGHTPEFKIQSPGSRHQNNKTMNSWIWTQDHGPQFKCIINDNFLPSIFGHCIFLTFWQFVDNMLIFVWLPYFDPGSIQGVRTGLRSLLEPPNLFPILE